MNRWALPLTLVLGCHPAPARTVTTRTLLGTSPLSVLTNPFVTADTSYGNFVGILFTTLGNHTAAPVRAFVSQSPAGVTLPVATFPSIERLDPSATSLHILAPFTGTEKMYSAQLWVSASNADGSPVAYASKAQALTVSLFRNDVPDTYVLTSSAPVTFAGRQWVKLALIAPVAIPEGGWFSIVITDTATSFQLQAPEVAEADASAAPVASSRTPQDDAAVLAYINAIRR